MTTKLNLTIDEKVVAKSKRFAATQNTSVSKLVEELLVKHIEKNKEQKKSDFIKRTAGIIKTKQFNLNTEKATALKEKYGL
jgi:flagellin-specific chaperone FliS